MLRAGHAFLHDRHAWISLVDGAAGTHAEPMSTWTAWRTRIAEARWSLVPLRLLVGFGFVAHGCAKLERGPHHFAAVIAAIGLPAPEIAAWTTTLVELAGGIAMMLGAFVAPVSLVLGVVMVTALVAVHLPYGFSSVRLVELTRAGARFGPVGYEINLLYIGALTALAAGGASPLSVDRWRSVRRGDR